MGEEGEKGGQQSHEGRKHLRKIQCHPLNPLLVTMFRLRRNKRRLPRSRNWPRGLRPRHGKNRTWLLQPFLQTSASKNQGVRHGKRPGKENTSQKIKVDERQQGWSWGVRTTGCRAEFIWEYPKEGARGRDPKEKDNPQEDTDTNGGGEKSTEEENWSKD